MSWRPNASIATLEARAAFLALIREYFAKQQVMEVETSLLAEHTVTDLHLNTLSVHDARGVVGYLQTSPEYMMKRLLAAGSGSIYQICKAFRADELGQRHQPEFSMLEWYRVGYLMHELIDEVIVFISSFSKEFSVKKISYSDVFMHFFDLNPLQDNLLGWQSLVQEHIDTQDLPVNQDDCLDMLMTHVVAPNFPVNQITCVYDFPASQAALACLDTDNPGIAKRFEVYWGEVELANGYQELTDPREQKKRLLDDNAKRKLADLPPCEIDQYLLGALTHGLPECSGVALGLDRLLMLHMNKKSIADVLAFPKNFAQMKGNKPGGTWHGEE